MSIYYRPLVQNGPARPAGAVPLAGQSLWFTHVEALRRGGDREIVAVSEVPSDHLDRLTQARADIAGLDMQVPHIMGILNATPDSFSDGGVHSSAEAARMAAAGMVTQGATILDIGGESTRPGADFVPAEQEIARTRPVIEAIRSETDALISIDTRKASVAKAACDAGAGLVNDVSGFTFDADLAPFCAAQGAPVCVMHMQGDPATMQDNPHYDNVLLDVYDFLENQIAVLEGLGLSRDLIIVDPGIGFGKTEDHNLTLLRNLSLFHGLGCPILLGVSRKGFIGSIGQEPRKTARTPGSIAVALAGLSQGVQIIRVHDVAETSQALRLWAAVR
ncbi:MULTISPECIES: dihydropteroate synthase [unclassified Ruegeria]|uniref:dihydropteroate synthase n=1 Tax=unclassified Ruegeria TaxID=2625375 RepID=UPI001488D530|nr:dihydropteroate synthase [Ruegeria sp. HKCCD7303]NOE33206.1 dihydropteroate synthase [Ruegeria sp. HKCCD7318]